MHEVVYANIRASCVFRVCTHISYEARVTVCLRAHEHGMCVLELRICLCVCGALVCASIMSVACSRESDVCLYV